VRHYFNKEVSKPNTSSPQWLQATISDGTTTSSGTLSLPAMRTSPSYDLDGNLTADSEWIYTWDAENRLIRVERTAAAIAAGAPYHRELHDYDYRSRRIRTRIFANTGTTPSSHVLYIFDGWKCVAELSSSGLPLRKYTWGLDLAGSTGDTTTGNIGALLWLVDAPTAKTHLHLYDKNGNVTGLLDTTIRKRSATYDYDAFGQLITCYGDYAKLNPFTYSTKFTDYATGLRYYGYRWYGAKDGRWLSRDPIGEKGGVNLYGFIGNDGVNYIDFLGLWINNKWDAIKYWRSFAGGSETAGPDLIQTIIDSSSFKENQSTLSPIIKNQIIKEVSQKKLCCALTGVVSRSGKKIGMSVGDLALGSIDLVVSDYKGIWKSNGSTLGFVNISYWAVREFSFDETYNFNNPSWLSFERWSEAYAGPGKEFQITGNFKARISGDFNLSCW
jgi:RHS repeat-associated protein